MPERGVGRSAGAVTRDRILDAAVETLKREGLHGASARAIARTGGFNPALIFYHFDSVENALLLAAERSSEERISRYRERLVGLTSLRDLVGVARELHAEDATEGNITVLTQMLAGTAGSPELAARMRASFQPWLDVVAEALRQVVGGTPFEEVVDVDDLAFAVASMFLGIELLTHLEPAGHGEPELFDSLDRLATLVEGVLELGPISRRIARRRLRPD